MNLLREDGKEESSEWWFCWCHENRKDAREEKRKTSFGWAKIEDCGGWIEYFFFLNEMGELIRGVYITIMEVHIPKPFILLLTF